MDFLELLSRHAGLLVFSVLTVVLVIYLIYAMINPEGLPGV